MEEQPKNETAVPVEQPKPAPAPRGAALWLKAIAVLYALSLLAAIPLINRADAARKNRKDMDISGLSSITSKAKPGVGVVEIYGAISQAASSRPWDHGSQQIAKRIQELSEDKEVKAILLDINSPGGSVGSVQEIYSEIKRAKAISKKPFVARFGEVSASGGYYVASACDSIVALPGTITGSIGVIFSVNDFDGLMKKVGFKNEAIKSGKFKDIGSPMRDMTPEERKLLQGLIDDSYEQFVAAVADGRKMTVDKVKLLADGRIFTGRQAKDIGLVDRLGDLQDALDDAGDLAGIGHNPRVIREAEPFEQVLSLFDSKLQHFGFGASAADLAGTLQTSPSLEYRWYGH
jgi:protease-4